MVLRKHRLARSTSLRRKHTTGELIRKTYSSFHLGALTNYDLRWRLKFRLSLSKKLGQEAEKPRDPDSHAVPEWQNGRLRDP